MFWFFFSSSSLSDLPFVAHRQKCFFRLVSRAHQIFNSQSSDFESVETVK